MWTALCRLLYTPSALSLGKLRQLLNKLLVEKSKIKTSDQFNWHRLANVTVIVLDLILAVMPQVFRKCFKTVKLVTRKNSL